MVEASKDNPVFYVQYAHARISSLHRKAKEEGVDLAAGCRTSLCSTTMSWPSSSSPPNSAASSNRRRWPRAAPHRILPHDLAAAFHAQWNKGNDDPRGVSYWYSDPELTRARLELASAIGQIIRNGLGIMGVAAAEEMQ